jgi:hypothetical protein
MKYIKTYELFDNEELKSQFEIPYLKGDLNPGDISKWKPVGSDLDPDLNRFVNEVPWLIEMSYRRSGNVLSVGFDNHINYGKNKDGKDESVFYYFLVEIVKFREEYSLNVYSRCQGNGHQIYNESMIRKSMPYKEVVSLLRLRVFDMLVKFNNFIRDYFGQSHFSISDKDKVVFNPRLN